MCRFFLYNSSLASPLPLSHMLLNPSHSIIVQSYEAKERKVSYDLPPALNADGCGIGWYPTQESEPVVLVSVLPAWSAGNMRRAAEGLKGTAVLAHVRAAPVGSAICEQNCHPFYDPVSGVLFAHNGHVAGFAQHRKDVVSALPADIFNQIQGTTDSEYAFALIRAAARARGNEGRLTPDALVDAVCDAIDTLEVLPGTAGSLLNFALATKDVIAVTRYVIGGTSAGASLYYAVDKSGLSECGRFLHQDEVRPRCSLVASEPVTSMAEEWCPVPSSSLLLIERSTDRSFLIPIDPSSRSAATTASASR